MRSAIKRSPSSASASDPGFDEVKGAPKLIATTASATANSSLVGSKNMLSLTEMTSSVTGGRLQASSVSERRG